MPRRAVVTGSTTVGASGAENGYDRLGHAERAELSAFLAHFADCTRGDCNDLSPRHRGQYWDSVTWQPWYTQVGATLAEPGAPFSLWNFDMPVTMAGPGDLAVTARAYSTSSFDHSVPRFRLRPQS